MFWTFTFTNPREQANVLKSISTIQWHTVWQHMLWSNLNFRNEKIGSFHNILQPNLYIRIFPDGMILYSIRSEYYSTNPHNIQDGGVWMLTIYYGTMIHLNNSWKQFMSTEGLLKYFPLLSVSENQIFPRNTYFHIFPHIPHIFPFMTFSSPVQTRVVIFRLRFQLAK